LADEAVHQVVLGVGAPALADVKELAQRIPLV
jgi:hypothetical protein